MTAGAMLRHIEVPYESPTGAWAGNRFLLYGFDGHQGALWTLTPESTTLGSAVKIAIPGFAGNCQHLAQNLAVGGDHLFFYELFGGKLDSRDFCGTNEPGGVFEIEASTGAVLSHLAPSSYFGRLAVAADGEHLYGIGISDRWTGVRLVEIERKTGDVVAEQRLEDDVWNIATARIPAGLVPHGYVTPAACSKPLQ